MIASLNRHLKHKLCRTHLDSNFYFNRIPRLWNSLPTLDTNLPLPAIKSRLRQFFWDNFMSNFDSNNTCSFHYLCPCPRCSHNPVNMHFSHSLAITLYLFCLVRLLAQCQLFVNTVSLSLSFYMHIHLLLVIGVVKRNNNNNNIIIHFVLS